MNEPSKGLCGLRIGNFKAFAETQQISIRPLTLIYGANSAGKSSVIHSLLLANHALENGNVDVHQTKIGGASLDLGGFSQYVHKHELKRRFEWGIEFGHKAFESVVRYLDGFTLTAIRFQIGLPDTEHQKQPDSNAPRVLAFELHLDGSQLMGLELQPDARLHSVCLNFEHPILKAALDKLLDDEARRPSGAYLFVDQPSEEEKVRWEQEQKEYKARLLSELDGIEQVIEEYIRKVPFSTEHFLPAGLVPEGEESEYAYAMPDEQPDAIMDSFDQGGAEGIARKLRYEIEQLFKLISRSISARLNRITYLGPLRCYPPRHSTGMHDQDPNWFSGGGQAWEILRGDPDVLMAVNQWLAAPDRLAKGYELLVRDLSNIQKIAPELQAGLEDALGKLRAEPNASITEQVESVLKKLTASKSGVVLSEIILQDIRSKTEVSHRDIGQGISQVLPILVSAFALEKQIVAIEQPELHLHPGLQAELGDVFIESALGERANKFLIESVTSGMGQQDAF